MTGDVPYDVALSFCAPQRAFAERVKTILGASGLHVFYDFDFQSEMVSQGLMDRLPQIYGAECRFALIFLSKDYTERAHTMAELRAAVDGVPEVILIRFDDSPVEDLPPDIVFLNAATLSPTQIAEIVVQRATGDRARRLDRLGIAVRYRDDFTLDIGLLSASVRDFADWHGQMNRPGQLPVDVSLPVPMQDYIAGSLDMFKADPSLERQFPAAVSQITQVLTDRPQEIEKNLAAVTELVIREGTPPPPYRTLPVDSPAATILCSYAEAAAHHLGRILFSARFQGREAPPWSDPGWQLDFAPTLAQSLCHLNRGRFTSPLWVEADSSVMDDTTGRVYLPLECFNDMAGQDHRTWQAQLLYSLIIPQMLANLNGADLNRVNGILGANKMSFKSSEETKRSMNLVSLVERENFFDTKGLGEVILSNTAPSDKKVIRDQIVEAFEQAGMELIEAEFRADSLMRI